MSSHTPVVLVTGATGAFGRLLIDELLAIKHVRLVLLVRASSSAAARQRILDQNKIGEETQVYRGDLSHPDLGLSPEDYYDLTSRVTHILHSAASTRFNLPLRDARLQNVVTTEHMLKFAKDCRRLTRFMHMSSALVAGKRTGLILESEYEHTSGFINTYERTKYEAEKLVRENLEQLKAVIVRPPLIISKVHEGHQGPVNLLAQLIHLINKNLLPYVPGPRSNVFDMVSGDDTAKIVVELLLKNQLHYSVYHISNGPLALTTGQVADILEKSIGKPLNVEFIENMREYSRRVWWASLLKPKIWYVYKKISHYLPEAAHPKVYDRTHLNEELGISTMPTEPAKVLSTMFK